jgi:hypothetical protein
MTRVPTSNEFMVRSSHERAGLRARAAIVSCVFSDTVNGALIAAGALVLGALIAAAAGLFANWASHRWNLEERSAERQEVRRLALVTQRVVDLRELADNLTEMVTAAKEIAWERTGTEKLMPRSDPRAMRLTQLINRNRFLRRIAGDEELRELAGAVAGTANRLPASDRDDINKDMVSADQALAEALERVASLIREAESS